MTRSRVGTFFLSIVLLVATGPAAASTWSSLVSLPDANGDASETISALERFAIASQLGDAGAVAEALADSSTWSAHLREWARARWAWRHGDRETAASAFERAAHRWPATLEEPAAVLSVFDRERVRLAFERGDTARAAIVLARPLRAHGDAGWKALVASLRLRRGDAVGAARAFDLAWSNATRSERAQPAFFDRSLAHLAAADTAAAAEAWIDLVEALRRPEHQRAALACWDSLPALARSVESSPRRRVVLDWLGRLFRREEASRLARQWYERSEGKQRADLFVFVTEQEYRLRRHEQMFEWLGGAWPDALDAEQRAALEAYPWGVRRRGGSSEEIAAGFDAVADRYPTTARGAEARWEAAWMWELSDREDLAIDRYERYVEMRPDGPFARAAALRTVFLRWRAGNSEEAVAARDRHASRFGDDLEGAAATWLSTLALRDLGRTNEADALQAQLQREHVASPLWREELALAPPPDDVDGRLSRLAQIQERAWERVARALEVEDLGRDLPDELMVIDRLAELGLIGEAETRLAEWADARRSDTVAIARACGVAFRRGLSEMQGRYGWILERRLADRDAETARAALVASLPTPFARTVLELARERGVPAELVWSVMRRESFYDADVLSIAGAYGLLQLLPSTAGDMAERIGRPLPSPEELFVPRVNLDLGIGYLAGLLREADGDRIRALASYNAGETNGERWQARRRPGEPMGVGILVISYSETRAYVYHVLRHWLRYTDAYGGPA